MTARAGKKSGSSPPQDGARHLALALLTSVLEQNRPLEEGFGPLAARAGGVLEERDRAFARLLTATVLRRLGILDALLKPCLAHPKHTPDAVLMLLRLGAAQLLFLETPPHAAVDTTVTLARQNPVTAKAAALVNAVLRRVSREGPDLLAGLDVPRLALPSWLWNHWCRDYGEATTRACAMQVMADPPLDLTLRDDTPENRDLWAQRLEANILPTGTLRRPGGGAIPALPGFDEGAWWVQDAAAALPVRLLAPRPGQRIFDLCAAPGGKTAQLAAAGARVVAVDRSAARLARLQENMARLGLSAQVSVVAADAATWKPASGTPDSEPADAILLDAPCSGTGTLRRHPDIAHLKTPDDASRLIALQDRLLRHAVTLLRPGGTLVYTVCSMDASEGEARIAALLGADDRLARRSLRPEDVGGLGELISPAGDLRTLPCHLAEQGGMDGFFATRLVRVS